MIAMIRRAVPALALAALAAALGPRAAHAGPPFVTDDPVPVDPGHGELYLASELERGPDGWSGAAPLLELNYGAAPGLQLHVVLPVAFERAGGGPTEVGPGDTELGAKLRLLEETRVRPQLAVFPIAILPTGDDARGLGDGGLQLFLPVWLQKSVGAWTAFGGGGVWLHGGVGARDWLLAGVAVQRRLAAWISVGAELYHATADTEAGAPTTGATLGAMLDVTEVHHVLASVGRGLGGDPTVTAYLAYQATFGP